MVLHGSRYYNVGVTMLFAIKEVLLRVTKAMRPPPHQLLVTEEALLHQHLHCPEMHFVVTSLHPGQQSMAPQHGVP